MEDAPQHYTALAKWLHWSTALLWIVAAVLGLLAVYFRDAINTDHMVTYWHKAIASTILFLVIVRVAWRMFHPAPAMPATMSPRMQLAAKVGHYVLYALALALLPLSGWVWSSVADKPIMLLGLVQLPPLIAPNPDAYQFAKWIHVSIAWTSMVLVVGHIGAALKHHWIDKDYVLTSMLPSKRRRPG